VTLSAQIQCARDDWTLLTPGHTTGDELARDCIAALDLIVPQVNGRRRADGPRPAGRGEVSDVDFLWRQGQARMLFVVSDVGPRVPAHTGSKRLGVDNGDVTLYMEDGRWTLGSVSLYGRGCAKTARGASSRAACRSSRR
jgi:hypothetical protein